MVKRMKKMKKIIQMIVMCSVMSALAGCGLFSAKDNTPPPTKLVTFNQTMNFNEEWDSSTGAGVAQNYLKLAPAFDADTIYTASYKGELTAVNAKKGNVLWHVETSLPVTAGPTVDQGRVFVGTSDARVAAYDAMSGKLLWQTPVSGVVLACPTSAQGHVFVKTIDGELIALNAATGKQEWNYVQEVPSLILRGSSPAVDVDDRVVAGFANGKVAAVSDRAGSELWIQTIAAPTHSNVIDNMVDINAMPVVKNGVVYVVTYQGYLAALNLSTGALIWHHTLSSYSGLVLDDTHVYATDAQSHVWAFDQSTGQVLWVQKALAYRTLTTPALMNDAVVVADLEGYIHALSTSDGHFVSRVNFNSHGVLASPLVVNNVLYLIATDGTLAAYTLSNIKG